VAWQDQGRQEHGWFGHGTAAQDDVDDATNDSLFGAGGLEVRIQAVAYCAVAAFPSALREQAATLFDAAHLARLTETMKVWIGGARLDQAQFAALFFGRAADDPVVVDLRRAAQRADMAKSHTELREAASHLAAAVQAIGLTRWSRFLAEAQARAGDPATVAAVDKSREPPTLVRDAIRPVYPVETALGIGAAALIGGTASGVRTAGAAVLRQIGPGHARPTRGQTPAEILAPGGKPIGNAGTAEEIRELPGGRDAAEQLFHRLKKGAIDVTPPGYPGTLVRTPNGGYIGFRAQSKSRPPTIDVKQPHTTIQKLKFTGDK
jgi:hypothetical protein